MEVRFRHKDLDRLEVDASFSAKLAQDVVKSYRKKMQVIRAATNEQDFYAMKSLHYEKLKGDRANQRSMRLNDKWRLVLAIVEEGGKRIVEIIEIADYH